MGAQFEIRIVGIGLNGCDTKAVPGQSLYNRCKRLDCVDCLAQDFVQMLRQKGYRLGVAAFTHNFGTTEQVIDDVLKNERQSGTLQAGESHGTREHSAGTRY